MNNVIALMFGLGIVVAGCGKKDATPAAGSAAGSGSAAYLTVGKYCDAFCGKLCNTCGQNANCDEPCHKRCYFGRTADKVLDGSDPKTGLALTQTNLDGCIAAITKDSCMAIASGQVPPVCFTIQH
jgi:hypothetical protein